MQQDIEQLNTICIPKILELLNDRYDKDEIYTWASSSLIAINPFKDLPHLYHCDNKGGLGEATQPQATPPHVYSIAEKALSTITSRYSEHKDSSIIVSGESGSGKTESTKHLLRYLTAVKSENTFTHHHAREIEKHILAFNPILEAFGNARTPCNDNSSRFGKYISLQYDSEQRIIGSYIQTYLLEKTRVVHRSQGNFNFHIFYQFVAGLNEEGRQLYLLNDTFQYNYIQGDKNVCIASHDDAIQYNCTQEDIYTARQGHITSQIYTGIRVSSSGSACWSDTMNCLFKAGFSFDDQDNLCRILGAILCLGNVEMKLGTNEHLELKSYAEVCLPKVSGLLGLDNSQLCRCLCYRQISMKMANRRSVFCKPCTIQEAVARRDCIAKLLYSRLFDWLVSQINFKLRCSNYESFIGLLDIYGFEVFEINCLEQLCINYANERLQHHFRQSYLRTVQNEYEQEGITAWQHVDMCSNDSCVQFIERHTGLFSLLNQECQLNRLTSNSNIADKISHSLTPDCNLSCSLKHVRQSEFVVHHYASAVTYSTRNLVEKNGDNIPEDLVEVLLSSDSPFVTELLNQEPLSVAKGKAQKKTVLSKFKQSLDELLKILKSTDCHYIRCIKPNRTATGDSFDPDYVSAQLTACGVMETVLIRSQMHPVRLSYGRFLHLYGVLLSKKESTTNTFKENRTEFKVLPSVPRKQRKVLHENRLSNLTASAGPEPDVVKLREFKALSEIDRTDKNLMCRVRDILRCVPGLSTQTNEVLFGRSQIFIRSEATMRFLDEVKNRVLCSYAVHIQRAWRAYSRSKRERQRITSAAAVIIRVLRRNVLIQREQKEVERRTADRLMELEKALQTTVTVRKRRTVISDQSEPVDVCVGAPALSFSNTDCGKTCDDRRDLALREKHLDSSPRLIIWGDGIVSIRSTRKEALRFHASRSTLLKDSHKIPVRYLLCGLLDCL